MPRVLMTGSAGFIGGYLVEDLLAQGWDVVGIDNYSKYGPIKRSYDDHPNYHFTEGDARDTDLLIKLLTKAGDHFIAAAAMIGGTSLLPRPRCYDLMAINERIIASSTATPRSDVLGQGSLKKVTYVSSSMAYGSTDRWPSVEGALRADHPDRRRRATASRSWPSSSGPAPHGISTRRCTRSCAPSTPSAWGSSVRARRRRAGVAWQREAPALSHVVPDLIQKVLKGQDPLHILGDGSQVRCYTHGSDLSGGIIATLREPQRAQRGLLQHLRAHADHGARAVRADLEEDQGRRSAADRARRPVRARHPESASPASTRRRTCSASRRP